MDLCIVHDQMNVLSYIFIPRFVLMHTYMSIHLNHSDWLEKNGISLHALLYLTNQNEMVRLKKVCAW